MKNYKGYQYEWRYRRGEQCDWEYQNDDFDPSPVTVEDGNEYISDSLNGGMFTGTEDELKEFLDECIEEKNLLKQLSEQQKKLKKLWNEITSTNL